jgi:hypothetical protein
VNHVFIPADIVATATVLLVHGAYRWLVILFPPTLSPEPV